MNYVIVESISIVPLELLRDEHLLDGVHSLCPIQAIDIGFIIATFFDVGQHLLVNHLVDVDVLLF